MGTAANSGTGKARHRGACRAAGRRADGGEIQRRRGNRTFVADRFSGTRPVAVSGNGRKAISIGQKGATGHHSQPFCRDNPDHAPCPRARQNHSKGFSGARPLASGTCVLSQGGIGDRRAVGLLDRLMPMDL